MQIFETPDPAADAVAIDTALFQSASSYFARANDLADPDARACFAAVASPFCNGAALIVPVLSVSARGANEPEMMVWWPGHKRHVGGLDAVGALTPALYDAFVITVEEQPEKVTKWLKFQFAADLVDQNFSDQEREDYNRDLPEAKRLILEQKLPYFTREIQKGLPPKIVGQRHGWSAADHVELAVGFALSFFIRGWLYGFALDQHWLRPRYRHLWFRENAFLANPVDSVARALDYRRAWYPWGEILTHLFRDDPDPVKVKDVLIGLREQSGRFRIDFEEAVAADHRSPVSGDAVSERERVVIETLERLNVFPELRDPARLASALGILRQLIAFLIEMTQAAPAGTGGVAIEQIAALLPAHWTSRTVHATTKQFFRDTYWQMYRGTNLRQLLRWSDRDLT